MPDTGLLPYHTPVLRDEVLAYLNPQPGQTFVDATVGGGGHAQAIASLVGPGGHVIGIDRDPDALAQSKQILSEFGPAVTLAQARFDTLNTVLDTLSIAKIDGVLFDFGVSSYQLDTPARGFSFKEPEALLDMRMNPQDGGPTAADLLNTLPERALANLIRDNSDENWASRIARFIAERRAETPYQTVGQLVETVLAAMPSRARPEGKHAATRTFQALRIAVNDELISIEHALEAAVTRLAPGGTLVALSYHSLEDRLVKQLFTRLSGRGPGEGPYGTRPPAVLELLTRKPVGPSAAEVAANPRARSAVLRAARHL